MRSIKNWVLATFILSFLVILAGGVVRTTQSGMGCPDWPKCFGKWIPPTNAAELPADFEKYLRKQDIDHTFNALHTWIEYLNRLLGVLLGVFAIVQAALLYIKRTELKRSYKLSLLFLLTVILTGLFGAIVVRFNLAHASISVHLFFALLLTQIQLALFLSIHSKLFITSTPGKLKKLLFVLLGVILIQTVLGTVVRMYIDDVAKGFHYGQRENWLADTPIGFLIHRSFSWVVVVLGVFIAWYFKKNAEVKYKLYLLAGIILSSMATGITLYYANFPAAAQPIHLLLASLAITQTTSLILQLQQKKIFPGSKHLLF